MTIAFSFFERFGQAASFQRGPLTAAQQLPTDIAAAPDQGDTVHLPSRTAPAAIGKVHGNVPALPLPPRNVYAADGVPLVPDEIAQVLGIAQSRVPPIECILASIDDANAMRHPRLAVLSKLYGRPDDGRGIPVMPNTRYSLEDPSILRLYEADSSIAAPKQTFQTDHHARPIRTAGVIALEQGNRRGAVDPMLARLGEPGDVGFHLGANSFGFPGGPLNVVPGDDYLNQKDYRAFEQLIENKARRLLNLSRTSRIFPKRVISAEFQAYYLPENRNFRPDLFQVSYWTAPLRFPLQNLSAKESAIFFNGKRIAKMEPRLKARSKRLKKTRSVPF